MGNQTNTPGFGVHFMIDGYGAPKKNLENKEAFLTLLRELPGRMGMYPICEPQVVEVGPNNKKDPGGFSGFVMIAESHISFHTFPNRGFVTIDVYTCQDELDTEKFLNAFRDVFEFSDEDTHFLRRGPRYPVTDIHTENVIEVN